MPFPNSSEWALPTGGISIAGTVGLTHPYLSQCKKSEMVTLQ